MNCFNGDCLFCKLSKDKQNMVLENEHVFVLLDRFPLSDEHFLIIPKTHVAFMHELENVYLEEIIKMIKYLVKRLKITKYNIVNNNQFYQIIFHVHFHLVAANESGNFRNPEPLKLTDDEYDSMVSKYQKKLFTSLEENYFFPHD